jgi:antitoxin component of MazEF toxin-antitoxin module
MEIAQKITEKILSAFFSYPLDIPYRQGVYYRHMTIVKVRKTGNSYAVSIPAKYLSYLQVGLGSHLVINGIDGELRLYPAEFGKLSKKMKGVNDVA